jgi:hypothetical protein
MTCGKPLKLDGIRAHTLGVTKHTVSIQKERNMTLAEAETYDWWSDYLTARMKAIEAMTLLGENKAFIMHSIGVDKGHAEMLIASFNLNKG